MSVSNPNNRSGIDFQIVDEIHVPQELYIPSDASSEERNELLETWYERYVDSEYCGQYHLVVMGEVRQSDISGWGDSPGYSSIADGRKTDSYDSLYSRRSKIATHELLHNIVGDIQGDHVEGDSGHTEEGWLSEDTSGESLSDSVSDQLNSIGFRDRSYYDTEIC